jgi:hypothetical protein
MSSIAAEERFVYVALETPAELRSRSSGIPAPAPRSKPPKRQGRRIALWAIGIFAVVLIGAGIAAQILMNRAEPMLRSRVIDTLSSRFDSRVSLGDFHVSVIKGFEAEGSDLRLYPRRFITNTPLIAIAKFSFRVSWASILESPMHVGVVKVEGLAINIPPKQDRLPSGPNTATSAGGTDETRATNVAAGGSNHPGIKIVVDEVLILNTRLLIGTSKPGKLPLDFEISRIALHKVGPGQPMKFEATLVNPKPVGNIQSTGYFGPFQQDSPGETPVSGSYFFSHADLATFKGIGGILSSTGKYQGPLNHLTVDGQVSVPDFRLDTGNHPMPLHAVFHSIVDGITGDTYLQPVDAQLGHSRFSVSGSIVKVPAGQGRLHGHNISLDVVMKNARIEDFLKLAIRTDPPVLNGNLGMNAKIVIPPGEGPVTDRLELNGKFDIDHAGFSSEKIQEKVNMLSRLGQGHPKDPDLRLNYTPVEPNAPTELQGAFSLANARMDFPDLNFSVPGAVIDMTGIYTLDGNKFDFHGQAKLQAHPSQMTTGWKSLLLKAVDPFFAKNGYGTEIPIEVSGTKADPHFGLDFGYKPPK